VTSFIGNHGVVAVFLLMAVAAVLPAASEVTMLYGGALASGALAGQVGLFGYHFGSGTSAYFALVVAGIAGNWLGAAGGWAIGVYGGHPLLERHGRKLHVTPERIERAERWFARFGGVAVPAGFLTPVIRSFVAIPAGIAELKLRRFLLLAACGIVPYCLVLGAAGWAVGSSWHTARHDLGYLDYLVVAGIVLFAAYLVVRHRRSTTMDRHVSDSPR
jgi:membrane protein DedA with SNARE-associated domain